MSIPARRVLEVFLESNEDPSGVTFIDSHGFRRVIKNVFTTIYEGRERFSVKYARFGLDGNHYETYSCKIEQFLRTQAVSGLTLSRKVRPRTAGAKMLIFTVTCLRED